MDRIEIGEYIRTIDGYIGVFDRYSKRPDTSIYKSPFNCFIKLQNRKTSLQCSRDYITNHSKNIIDLIEIGDYVNEYVVEDFYLNARTKERSKVSTIVGNFNNNEIETIVTKEQFKKVQYKINN